jgi:hypothetical protein
MYTNSEVCILIKVEIIACARLLLVSMKNGVYSDDSAKFALQEHMLLRQEIVALVAETRSVERNVLVAIGVIWGFLVLHPPLGADRWVWWVPPLFVVMGGIKTWASHRQFIQFSTYLMRTEAAFASAQGIEGWETFLASQKRYIVGSWVFSPV